MMARSLVWAREASNGGPVGGTSAGALPRRTPTARIDRASERAAPHLTEAPQGKKSSSGRATGLLEGLGKYVEIADRAQPLHRQNTVIIVAFSGLGRARACGAHTCR
jgi:hypothetical protein